MSLRGKIVTLYILILLLPTLLLSGGAVYLVIQSFHHSYLSTAEEAVQKTAQNVDFSKKSYDLLAVRTATDGELISRLAREYTERSDIVDTVNYVDRTFLITSKYLPGIADFRIYHTNETLVQDGGLLWRPEERMLSGMVESAWYQEAMNTPNSLLWSNVPGNSEQIIITRKIIGNNGSLLGMVYILLNYDAVFGELLDQPFNGGSMYIVDDSKRILAATGRSEIGNQISLKEWPSGDLKLGAVSSRDTDDASVLDLTGTKDLLIVQPLSSHWHLVVLMSMRYLDNQNRTILIIIVGSISFFLLLSISLMMTIVRNIVRRIRKLGMRMSDLSRGEFEVAIRYSEKDELGELENRFNSMSERLGKLVEDITRAGLTEKEQAFKALQAQINPHFIYNSLGLLRWRALDANDQEQIQIIDALTTFYRITLNNQISVIHIRDEIEHVKAYLDIYQFRYPNKVQIEWEIDDGVLDLFTIKTMLQPIVENCYLYGAITRKSGAVIRIKAVREAEVITMSVYDNGKGIPATVLQAIEEGKHTGKGNGFGTLNIKERLALYFGNQASLTITSEIGEWTLVSIVFPACITEPTIRREL